MSLTTPWLSCMAPCSAARPGVSIFGRLVPPCETAHAAAVVAPARRAPRGRPAAAGAGAAPRDEPARTLGRRAAGPRAGRTCPAADPVRPGATRAKWTSRREVVEYFLVARRSTAQAGRPDSALEPGRATVSAAAPAPLAQLAEQLTLNQWVLGSSPRGRTTAEALPRQHAAGPLVIAGTGHRSEPSSAPARSASRHPWTRRPRTRRRTRRSGHDSTRGHDRAPGVLGRTTSSWPCRRAAARRPCRAAPGR